MAEHQDKDQQTEKPTQRRLEEARRKGNIPMSRDVTATMVLGLLTILLVAVGGTLASDFAKSLHPLLGNADGFSFDNSRDLAKLLGDVLARHSERSVPVRTFFFINRAID
jgi:flagellar biosynthesis protein FlhB